MILRKKKLATNDGKLKYNNKLICVHSPSRVVNDILWNKYYYDDDNNNL